MLQGRRQLVDFSNIFLTQEHTEKKVKNSLLKEILKALQVGNRICQIFKISFFTSVKREY